MFLFQITNSMAGNISDSLGLLVFGFVLIAVPIGIRRIFKLEK